VLKTLYPLLLPIEGVVEETKDIKTFRLPRPESFLYRPGQFAEVFVPGAGEAPFSISSSPTDMEYLEFSVKRLGAVTSALHRLGPGDFIGIRGPYGNGFPLEHFSGSHLLFVGGGIGLAPLRSLIRYVLHPSHRSSFGEVFILYGARTPRDLVFRRDLDALQERRDLTLCVTVDEGDASWEGRVGLVPRVLQDIFTFPPSGWKSIVCGPPIMIKFTIKALVEMGFVPGDIITTLEMKMKCGLGKCGRCNIGPYYVCKDGPVFSYEELLRMPEEY
jgi:sulfhydrogenase subunit gamma (sulfur reductase)